MWSLPFRAVLINSFGYAPLTRLSQRTIIKTSCGARPYIRIHTQRNYSLLLIAHAVLLTSWSSDMCLPRTSLTNELKILGRCRVPLTRNDILFLRSRKRRRETLGVLARANTCHCVPMSQLKSGWKSTRSQYSAPRINRRDKRGLFFQTEFYSKDRSEHAICDDATIMKLMVQLMDLKRRRIRRLLRERCIGILKNYECFDNTDYLM